MSYKYINDVVNKSHSFDTTVENLQLILVNNEIMSVTGYRNGILVVAKVEDSILMTVSRGYFLEYSLESIRMFWELDNEIRNIIRLFLNKNCQTLEEVETQFMAKVLGCLV